MSKPVVNVKQGWVRGVKATSVLGEIYISFKGIPYAAPPIGDLRFQDPQPPEPWTGFRDAWEEGPVCAQKNMFLPTRGGDDCLYLNVATKSLKGARPVMVWIHGGAFNVGDGGAGFYSPDYLLKEDIVFVSMNYRLGILGFLNLDHEVVPGNAGLKDQVAALRWVKENIAQFGGDSNNITIFGESAGASSVHYLLLSPLTKGLYHKAILQSGSVEPLWGGRSTSVELAQTLAAGFGTETTDPREIAECLRRIPVNDLVDAVEKLRFSENHDKYISLFLPNVDDKSPNPLIPESTEEFIAKGFDVPVIIGYNSHEGILFMSDFPDEYFSRINEDFAMTLPTKMKALPPAKISELRELYFGDKTISAETMDALIQYSGDLNFTYGVHRAVEGQMTKRVPAYLYKFTHQSPNSFAKVVMRTKFEGTAHADDLKYLFHSAVYASALKIEPGTVEQTVSDRFVKMWTNFAKTGNPTPELSDLIPVKWEPVTSTTKNYMEISDVLNLDTNPDEDVIRGLKRILNHAVVD